MQAAHSPRRLPALTFPSFAMLASEQWLVGSHILTALAALFLGIFLGPFQAFRRSPFFMETFTDWQIPFFSYYYQALTVHGVINALFFTTFFIVGFSYFVTQRSLERPLWQPSVAWAAFASIFIGLGLVLYAIMAQRASVLYTFYPPLIAHPTFYIGLVLMVVGTWLVALNLFMTYASWRSDHPGEPVPLAVFALLTNFAMWCVGTLGVAAEILFMLLPMSLGWVKTTDSQAARALFWFFGHPLVYFWLIPAYVSWYTMLPKQTNSKLFSDPLGRVAFLMLMIFSTPVAVHHMFTDPGISMVSKAIHTFFTFIVAIPSLMTAFNVGAMLERAGRKRGGTGPLSWLWHQDFGNPVVAAQICAMILFIMGGFSGIIQASLTLNIALHNTSWIPGHFHMTLASATALTFMGITYWLLPLIRNRALWNRKVALGQVYTWLVGMLLFGHGMGAAGIAGAPRRTDFAGSPAGYLSVEAIPWLNSAAIGGAILLLSSILFYVNVIGTLAFSTKPVEDEAPISTTGDPHAPLILERWSLWLGIMFVLIVIAWGPVFAQVFDFTNGFKSLPFSPMGSPMQIK